MSNNCLTYGVCFAGQKIQFPLVGEQNKSCEIIAAFVK